MDVTVPLRGYVVSSDPYAREMLTELPSPCGDMLFHRWGGPNVVVTTLPSPRGDKLFPVGAANKPEGVRLPSPRGDKLFPESGRNMTWCFSYRPLAGISCFPVSTIDKPQDERLPSPRGDKLFPVLYASGGIVGGLPSPRGDKLFRLSVCFLALVCLLPSPRGDKLFPGTTPRAKHQSSYRPLAGISCFSKTIQIKRPCTGAELYSLPKRITQNCVQCKRQIEDSPTIQCEPGCFHPV